MVKRISSYRAYLGIIVYFLIFGALIALAASWLNYTIRYSDLSETLNVRANEVLLNKQKEINGFIDGIEKTLTSIERSEILENYLQQEDAASEAALEDLLLLLTRANRDYFQLRFLDAKGMEKVRVDKERRTEVTTVVPRRKLQDKSDRYYFKAAAELPPHMFWCSHLDLNVEHGQIEIPFKPTFRVSLPVYRNALFAGMLIVNVEMTRFLNEFRYNAFFNSYLIDRDGYFLYHDNPNFSWSRYTQSGRKVFDDFQEDAEGIMNRDTYVSGRLFSFALEEQFRNGEKIKMLLTPKQDFMAQQRRQNFELTFYLAIVILIIALPMGGLLAIRPARLQQRLSELLEKNLKYREIIDRYVITSETDLHGRITNVSSAFSRISGYEKKELLGKTHGEIKSGDMEGEDYEELWATITSGQPWSGELHNQTKEGSSYWVDTTILPEFDDTGKIIAYQAVSYDITDKKKLEVLSKQDPLTGLGNRAFLDQVYDKEFERVKRYGSPLSVILVDIDHFKRINDTHGHQVGDAVLIAVAGILRNNTRANDTIGRWGGEEFMAICPETTADNALQLAEKLRRAIAEYDFGTAGRQTASFGLAEYHTSDTQHALVKRADDALYRAKQGGRNRVDVG